MDYVQFETEDGPIGLHSKFFRKGYEETESDVCVTVPSEKEIQDAINLSKKLLQGELKEDMAEVKRPEDLIPQCDFPMYEYISCGFLRRVIIVAASLAISVGLTVGVGYVISAVRQATVCSMEQSAEEDTSIMGAFMENISSMLGASVKRAKVCEIKDKEFAKYQDIIEKVKLAMLGGDIVGGFLLTPTSLDCLLAKINADCLSRCASQASAIVAAPVDA